MMYNRDGQTNRTTSRCREVELISTFSQQILESLPVIGDPGHLETGEGCQSQCQDGSRSQSRLFWSSNIAAKSRSKTLMIFQDEEMPILTGNFSGIAVFDDTNIIVIVIVLLIIIIIIIIIMIIIIIISIIIGYILYNYINVIWMNDYDLTVTSLERWLIKGNHPWYHSQIALFLLFLYWWTIVNTSARILSI